MYGREPGCIPELAVKSCAGFPFLGGGSSSSSLLLAEFLHFRVFSRDSPLVWRTGRLLNSYRTIARKMIESALHTMKEGDTTLACPSGEHYKRAAAALPLP